MFSDSKLPRHEEKSFENTLSQKESWIPKHMLLLLFVYFIAHFCAKPNTSLYDRSDYL